MKRRSNVHSSQTEDRVFWFYVLLCRDGSFYGGFTTDPVRREAEHNAGEGAKYTRSRRPVHRIYQESFTTKHDALSAEAKFKRLTRKQKEHFLTVHAVKW